MTGLASLLISGLLLVAGAQSGRSGGSKPLGLVHRPREQIALHSGGALDRRGLGRQQRAENVRAPNCASATA